MNVAWMILLLSLLAIGACYTSIPVLLWMCYRQTANKGFIWLGVALLILPATKYALNPFIGHFVDQAAGGHQPWLFPFSLMGGPAPWMTVGQFIEIYQYMGTLLSIGLIAISLGVMARSFRKLA